MSQRVVFANLDFATRQAADQKVVDLFVKMGFVWMSFCEAKVDHVRSMLPHPAWGVVQNMSTKAKQGCAIAWLIGTVIVHRHLALKMGVTPGRARMLTRWLRIDDVWCDGIICRYITGHWPPPRYKYRWANRAGDHLFNWMIKARIKWSPNKGYWVVFADFNQSLYAAGTLLGGQGHGVRPCGIVTGPNMVLDNVVHITEPKDRGWIDHVAVGGTLHALPKKAA